MSNAWQCKQYRLIIDVCYIKSHCELCLIIKKLRSVSCNTCGPVHSGTDSPFSIEQNFSLNCDGDRNLAKYFFLTIEPKTTDFKINIHCIELILGDISVQEYGTRLIYSTDLQDNAKLISKHNLFCEYSPARCIYLNQSDLNIFFTCNCAFNIYGNRNESL